MEMIKKEEKKLVKKNLNLGSKMKRTMKWRIFVTPTMSCKKSSGQGILRGMWYHNLEKWLSHYFILFLFYFIF